MLYKVNIKTTIDRSEVDGWFYRNIRINYDNKFKCIVFTTDNLKLIEELKNEIYHGLKLSKLNRFKLIFPSMISFFEVIHID
jgi:hypothetical protein